MAGEDFYLLDKMAKLRGVYQLSGSPVLLAGRVSDRVPFGTGRSMLSFRRGEAPAEDYPFPDPDVYVHLKAWLDFLREFAGSSRREDPREAFLRSVAGGGEPADAGLAASILGEMGAFDAAEKAGSLNLSPRNLARRLHTWFDGFRTLRFLHTLRDRKFPRIPCAEAMARAPFVDAPGTEPEAILSHLREREALMCGEKACGVTLQPCL
jgi:hypothetical protein